MLAKSETCTPISASPYMPGRTLSTAITALSVACAGPSVLVTPRKRVRRPPRTPAGYAQELPKKRARSPRPHKRPRPPRAVCTRAALSGRIYRKPRFILPPARPVRTTRAAPTGRALVGHVPLMARTIRARTTRPDPLSAADTQKRASEFFGLMVGTAHGYGPFMNTRLPPPQTLRTPPVTRLVGCRRRRRRAIVPKRTWPI